MQNTEEQFRKMSDILADNVEKNLLVRVIFHDTKVLYMRNSIILMDNVTDNLLIRVILQNTEEQFMKESNILVDNLNNNLLKIKILHNTTSRSQECSFSRETHRFYCTPVPFFCTVLETLGLFCWCILLELYHIEKVILKKDLWNNSAQCYLAKQ